MPTELPTGTVTFLFTDIEGSTRLLKELGDGYGDVLAEHRRVLRDVWQEYDGVEVDTQGDAFFVAFSRATQAVAAAARAQSALAGGPVKVRMGLHTGEPVAGGEGYVGFDVHRAARIAAAGHGGQVLLSQATADLAGADVRDLGLHRLKDLSAPERIFQLGTDHFPPLKTLHETNLPVPATPFLGREQEVGHVAELLQRSDVRLVTLTGPGGSGKTRLALQAAAAAGDDYVHGVWWVPLSAIADPGLVGAAASQALGSDDVVAAAVGDKRLLLVLDNFEHLVDAAPLVAETIGSCPHLTVLVTSREPLHIDGEWEVAVDPLREREAVALFLQRAVAVRSDFAANGEVIEICRRLDCLPLAIELAAARVKVLALPALLERLEQRLPLLAGGSRSAPERQRTLRATIAWSIELLTPEEQATFAKLAIFAGGCTLEAAEEICGADVDAIASLVDKSLVRHSGDRYWMLQTIREYAAELLEEGGEGDAVRDRHAAYYLALAERTYAERFEQSVRRLEPENDNLRAALDHLEASAPSAYLQLAGALGRFWNATARYAEGARRLEGALASARDDGPQKARAVGLLGGLDTMMGRFSAAVSRLDEAVEFWRRSGDQIRLVETSNWLGTALVQAGENSRALELFEQNLELARGVDNDDLFQDALDRLCWVYLVTGQFERAEPLAEELGNGHYLADCAQHRRDYRLAERHRRTELEARIATRADYGQAVEVFGLAMIAGGLGRDEDAVRLEGAVEAKWEEMGVGSRPRVLETWRERDLGAARARLGEARATALYEEGRAMGWDEALELALGKTPSA
ncbi:MAG TPA: adenylate/guanylate cyclase domain-containing protein [Gaiellaceae bacterium]|nr:adenylate/guanylate cyclase domain-containing protein [Gaiellaceae bacterium]